MLVSCRVCHREYVASKNKYGAHYICSRCLAKNRENKISSLGLHPALERIWANNHDIKEGTRSPNTDRSKNALLNKRASLSDISGLPKIPGFEISYQIGRGAMGSVYRAREVKTGRLVAIKILGSDLSEHSDLVARFEREVYALKSLTNPNVVSIIDAGHVNDIHYFAMEFIEGITLRTRINRSPILAKEACFITSQILNGLATAHKHGIIHRDLKPENVLLAYDGYNFLKIPNRVILVDFGLVGIGEFSFDPHPNLTRSRVTMGTVNYMAPEQHIDAKRVDHRSDLYSAGVIFFEMLTGELPLGRYLLPSERDMGLPKEVDEILSLALSRNIEDRYASADHFLKDLNHIGVDELNLMTEKFKDQKVKNDFIFAIKSGIYRQRYILLLIVAGLFFAVGINLSLSKTTTASKHHSLPSVSTTDLD
jgi:serine/threonine protein kinase